MPGVYARPLLSMSVGPELASYWSSSPSRVWPPAKLCFKCFKHFKLMFQMFHVNVAYVASLCFNCFRRMCLIVSSRCCICHYGSIHMCSRVCFKCFTCFILML
jgi:hypothetical protein